MDIDGDKRFEDALTLLEERRFREAVDAFSELVTLSPDMTGAYGNRGLAYLNLGLDAKAREDFETVVRLDPDDPMGYSMLAEVSRFRGDPKVTLAHTVEALQLCPDEPQALFIRGWLFAKAGQWAEAEEDLAHFVQLTHERDNLDIADFAEACGVLAGENPVDDDGRPINSPDKADAYLAARGWSFNQSSNPDYEVDGQPCVYGHCIRNRPPLAPEAAEGCPVFGYSCPGGVEQVAWCREHPPIHD